MAMNFAKFILICAILGTLTCHNVLASGNGNGSSEPNNATTSTSSTISIDTTISTPGTSETSTSIIPTSQKSSTSSNHTTFSTTTPSPSTTHATTTQSPSTTHSTTTPSPSTTPLNTTTPSPSTTHASTTSSPSTTLSTTTALNTTTHKTTTQAPPPLPPTASTPSVNNWYVEENNYTCLMMAVAAQFQIKYKNTAGKLVTAELNVPKDAKVDQTSSFCKKTKQAVFVEFEKFSFAFIFEKESSGKFEVGQLSVHYLVTENLFPGAQNINETVIDYKNITLWSNKLGKSYFCKSNVVYEINKHTSLVVHDLQVEAFMKVKTSSRKFDTSSKCDGDILKTPIIVPIVVGCILGVMLTIVIIAFFVGKRRFSNRAYENL